MRNSKDKKVFWLKFSDHDTADLFKDAKPPDGITVSGPRILIEASADSGGIFSQILISFVKKVSVSVVARWLYENLLKGNKKSGKINNVKIVFTEASIRRLIQKQLADQKARERQYAKDHKKPRLKRR